MSRKFGFFFRIFFNCRSATLFERTGQRLSPSGGLALLDAGELVVCEKFVNQHFCRLRRLANVLTAAPDLERNLQNLELGREGQLGNC